MIKNVRFQVNITKRYLPPELNCAIVDDLRLPDLRTIAKKKKGVILFFKIHTLKGRIVFENDEFDTKLKKLLREKIEKQHSHRS